MLKSNKSKKENQPTVVGNIVLQEGIPYTTLENKKLNLSDNFWERLCKAYTEANNEIIVNHVIWNYINAIRENIHNALLSGAQEAKLLLSEPEKTDLYYGVDNIATVLIRNRNKNEDAMYIAECLVKLFNLFALCPIDELTQKKSPNYRYKTIDLNKTLDKLEKEMDMKINFPNPFSDEGGIITSKGVCSVRALYAILNAYYMRKATQDFNTDTIVEIGGGMGRTMYYLYNLGMKNLYSVDLPLGIVAQALFLASTLGEDALWFTSDKEDSTNKIKIVPPSYLEKNKINKCVMINTDSLTEMDKSTAQEYFEWAIKNASYLLSINHEVNLFTISDLAKELKVHKTSRELYWLRDGYVLESFSF